MAEAPSSADWYRDTDDKTLEVWAAMLRAKRPEEKLAQVLALCEFGNRLQIMGIRQLFPEADEREVFLRAAERRLGSELTRKVYGWSSESPSE